MSNWIMTPHCLYSLFLLLCTFFHVHSITVDEDNGEDSSSCLSSKTVSCKTLSYALSDDTVSDGIKVMILSTAIHLNSTIKIEGILDLSIQGNCTSKPVINCSGVWQSENNATGAGFLFHYSTNIIFHCLKMHRCGAAVTHENGLINTDLPFRSAIYMNNSTDVTISKVEISSSYGIGLAMFDVHGTVIVSESQFFHNRASKDVSKVSVDSKELEFMVGGGIHMNISTCATNYCTYRFVNCAFYDNVKVGLNHSAPLPALGNGAGMFVRFQNNVSLTTTHIINCYFTKNSALWGGGLFLAFVESATGNNVSIKQSCFKQNNATYYGGGGIDIGFYFLDDEHVANSNRVVLSKCVFDSNQAYYGGGYQFVF